MSEPQRAVLGMDESQARQSMPARGVAGAAGAATISVAGGAADALVPPARPMANVAIIVAAMIGVTRPGVTRPRTPQSWLVLTMAGRIAPD